MNFLKTSHKAPLTHITFLSDCETRVFVNDVIRYVKRGGELPEKPIILSFDDGTYNYREYLLPLLEKYDMKVTEVEYIVQWAEDHRSYEQKYKEQMCFHMCELFGVNHINCGLMENYSVAHTAQKLKELCHRAGKYTIGVEPMPYSGLPDVKKAWAVVKESGCENAKLILDSWHWLRANQPIDLSVLEGIPAEKIVSVQINDVYERPYAASILRDESMHDRLAPGTGCGNTAAFCRMLKEKGIEPKAMGVEVISDAILAKGVAAAAKFNFDNTVKVLQEGWPEAMPEK